MRPPRPWPKAPPLVSVEKKIEELFNDWAMVPRNAPKRAVPDVEQEWRFDAHALWIEFKDLISDVRDDFKSLVLRKG